MSRSPHHGSPNEPERSWVDGVWLIDSLIAAGSEGQHLAFWYLILASEHQCAATPIERSSLTRLRSEDRRVKKGMCPLGRTFRTIDDGDREHGRLQ